jgi:predicted amidohydrolase
MRKILFFIVFIPLFQTADGEADNPLDGWFEYSQRPALTPVFTKNHREMTLEISSTGHFRCNGSWKKSFQVKTGEYVRFRAEYSTEYVKAPRRSVLARVYWRDQQGNQVMKPEYPRLNRDQKSHWKILEDVFEVPKKAASADLELIFRWDDLGKVIWRNIIFETASRPPARKVKLGTLYYRHQNSTGPQENREVYGKYIEKAGREGVRVLCLPEGMTVVGTGKTYLEVAEPVPGPTTEYLGKLARKYQMYIVAGIYEKEGEAAYNIAVLIGPDGQLAGKYRKVSLPREEIEGGLTPGDDFPVFDTEFGRIGILICWDIQFPEGARRLAAKGAEIIFLPIWGGIEALYPARAIENQVVLVTSSFDSVTGIWGRKGEKLVEADEDGKLAVAEVDLSAEVYWEWLGNLRARIPREAPLVEEVENH